MPDDNSPTARTQGRLFRVTMSNGSVSHVVADGFDDAIIRVHQFHWQHQQWPMEYEDASMERPNYRGVASVVEVGSVIL